MSDPILQRESARPNILQHIVVQCANMDTHRQHEEKWKPPRCGASEGYGKSPEKAAKQRKTSYFRHIIRDDKYRTMRLIIERKRGPGRRRDSWLPS